MPIEDIQVPKAPKGWQPNSDQRARIANDPRLQRLSRDELFAMFGQRGGSFGDGFRDRARATAPTPTPAPRRGIAQTLRDANARARR
jgi:hypothetical protein